MKKTIWIIAIIAVVILGIVFYMPSLGSFSSRPSTGNQADAQDLLIKSETETVISMLQGIADRQQAGEMTLEQAKNLGAGLLRGMTYGNDGYFWADTVEGVNVVLYGNKDVEGTNRLENKDDHGNYYVKNFLSTGMAGGGYVEYWFPKKGETTAMAKRSYVLEFKPFGWVIGTGYYK